MNEKADHVRKASQSRHHTCHWPGCPTQVVPAMWGCSRHWFSLPQEIRDAIWDAYEPGQEDRMDPSPAYLEAARQANEWIRANHEVEQ